MIEVAQVNMKDAFKSFGNDFNIGIIECTLSVKGVYQFG